jgi:hypothetical protein
MRMILHREASGDKDTERGSGWNAEAGAEDHWQPRARSSSARCAVRLPSRRGAAWPGRRPVVAS